MDKQELIVPPKSNKKSRSPRARAADPVAGPFEPPRTSRKKKPALKLPETPLVEPVYEDIDAPAGELVSDLWDDEIPLELVNSGTEPAADPQEGAAPEDFPAPAKPGPPAAANRPKKPVPRFRFRDGSFTLSRPVSPDPRPGQPEPTARLSTRSFAPLSPRGRIAVLPVPPPAAPAPPPPPPVSASKTTGNKVAEMLSSAPANVIQLTPTQVAPNAPISFPANVAAPEKSTKPAPAALAALIDNNQENNQPLPPFSLALGVCSDGLPLLLDLFDPTPGSLLIVGDDPAANRQHLEAVLASAMRLNTPAQVRLDLITPKPNAFTLQEGPQLEQVLLPYSVKTFDLLARRFALAEDRLPEDSEKTPVYILALDELEVLLEQLDAESKSYLRWLLRRGPASRVWTIATLSTRPAAPPDWKTIRAFGSRLVGKIAGEKEAQAYGELPVAEVQGFSAGQQACMKLEDEVLKFEIPVFTPVSSKEVSHGDRHALVR